MSETEKLLSDAQNMALRSFEDPSQETVMALWQRLCDEADRRRYALEGDGRAFVLH